MIPSSPRTRGSSALRAKAATKVAKPAGGTGQSLRATPILLLPRRTAAHWTRLAPHGEGEAALGSRAQRVADYLAMHGASFFDEIAEGTRLLSTELEDALSELVARGRAHCDSFGGLRALLVPASKRPSALSRKRRRVPLFGIQDAGRWALVRSAPEAEADDAQARALQAEARTSSVEHIARVLLQRYGVVAWRLLEREAAWLPPWRELSRVYQRLEARGEIRGGRFIEGLSGEQFALPEAIGLLRDTRRRPHEGSAAGALGLRPRQPARHRPARRTHPARARQPRGLPRRRADRDLGQRALRGAGRTGRRCACCGAGADDRHGFCDSKREVWRSRRRGRIASLAAQQANLTPPVAPTSPA